MLDSVIGVFDDRDTARRALEALREDGWPVDRVALKRVLEMSYRGFDDSEAATSLMHAPEVPESAPLADDEGIPIVIVRTEREHVDAAVGTLQRSGAAETRVVEATPPLDL